MPAPLPHKAATAKFMSYTLSPVRIKSNHRRGDGSALVDTYCSQVLASCFVIVLQFTWEINSLSYLQRRATKKP